MINNNKINEKNEKSTAHLFAKIIPTAHKDRNLSDAEFRVYAAINVIGHKNGYCDASQEYIARKLKMHRPAINIHVKTLSEKKYFTREKKRLNNGSIAYKIILPKSKKRTVTIRNNQVFDNSISHKEFRVLTQLNETPSISYSQIARNMPIHFSTIPRVIVKLVRVGWIEMQVGGMLKKENTENEKGISMYKRCVSRYKINHCKSLGSKVKKYINAPIFKAVKELPKIILNAPAKAWNACMNNLSKIIPESDFAKFVVCAKLGDQIINSKSILFVSNDYSKQYLENNRKIVSGELKRAGITSDFIVQIGNG